MERGHSKQIDVIRIKKLFLAFWLEKTTVPFCCSIQFWNILLCLYLHFPLTCFKVQTLLYYSYILICFQLGYFCILKNWNLEKKNLKDWNKCERFSDWMFFCFDLSYRIKKQIRRFKSTLVSQVFGTGWAFMGQRWIMEDFFWRVNDLVLPHTKIRFFLIFCCRWKGIHKFAGFLPLLVAWVKLRLDEYIRSS